MPNFIIKSENKQLKRRQQNVVANHRNGGAAVGGMAKSTSQGSFVGARAAVGRNKEY